MTPHATTAEVFAKALLIAGSRQADRIAAKCNDLPLIAVDRTGNCGARAAPRSFWMLQLNTHDNDWALVRFLLIVAGARSC